MVPLRNDKENGIFFRSIQIILSVIGNRAIAGNNIRTQQILSYKIKREHVMSMSKSES